MNHFKTVGLCTVQIGFHSNDWDSFNRVGSTVHYTKVRKPTETLHHTLGFLFIWLMPFQLVFLMTGSFQLLLKKINQSINRFIVTNIDRCSISVRKVRSTQNTSHVYIYINHMLSWNPYFSRCPNIFGVEPDHVLCKDSDSIIFQICYSHIPWIFFQTKCLMNAVTIATTHTQQTDFMPCITGTWNEYCASYLSLQMLVLVSFWILYYISDDRNMRRVRDAFWELVWSHRLTLHRLSHGIPVRPYSVLSWCCRCFDSSYSLPCWVGSLMWVMSLQFVSAFSNTQKKKKQQKCQS